MPAVEPATAGPNARESVSVPKSAELSPNSGRARFVPGCLLHHSMMATPRPAIQEVDQSAAQSETGQSS